MNPQRILLIDDEKHMLEILKLIIETKSPYRCILADSAKIGLSEARNQKPDLIVLDINMPGMDGYQVCTELKGTSDTKDIPVLFLTAKNDTQSKLKAFRFGAVDYIEKPFDPDEIIARIKVHLDLKKTREENIRYLEMLYQLRYLNSWSTMVQGFAHNFNNLVTILSNQLSLLRKYTPEEANPTFEKSFHSIDRITELIKRLQIFAENKVPYYQVMDMNEVTMRIVKSFEIGLPATVKIMTRLEEPSPLVKGNIDLFWQSLVNLLTNSYEALEGKGEITIFSSREPRSIPGISSMVDYVCLSVKDNGKGIPKENLEKIFDPFFTTKPTVGAGLGLSMVYATIKRWEGDIQVISSVGEGTTVKLFFKKEERKDS